MNVPAGLALALHVLGAVIWVGGMFFAYMVLKPAAGTHVDGSHRFRLWVGVFQKFFPWVWKSLVVILVSGYFLVLHVFGGFNNVGLHVHVMHGTALLMTMLFLYLYFIPYPRLKRAVKASDGNQAGRHLSTIRVIVGVNLLLGLVTVGVAGFGRFM